MSKSCKLGALGAKTLILGAGNLLLSDEGVGVHCIRHLEQQYRFPGAVTLLDAGTLGIMVTHWLEDADRVYLLDALVETAAPGSCRRYGKDEFLWQRAPLKLSPHQIGLREMLQLAEMRGRGPREVFLLGFVPASTTPGLELSPVVRRRMVEIAANLASEVGGTAYSL